MTIELNKLCEKTLREELTKILAKVRFDEYFSLDYKTLEPLSKLNTSLPSSGALRASLEEMISEEPLSDFISSELSNELILLQSLGETHQPGLLTNIERFSDTNKLADTLLSRFKTLPWDYTFTLDIGTTISSYIGDEEHVLTQNIKLIKASPSIQKSYPNKKLQFGIASPLPHLEGGWNSESTYIQIESSGYLSEHGETETSYRAMNEIKTGLGLLNATWSIDFLGINLFSSNRNCLTHIRQNNSWQQGRSVTLSTDIADAIAKISVGVYLLDKPKNEISSHFRLKTDLIFRALSYAAESEKIRLAARWLFESHCGRNQMLSFVQNMVALEILLGDKDTSDVTGLSVLLRNRCAYLIGNNHKQRANILEDFKKIYAVRSKIVHRGKSKLTKKEFELFIKLQWITYRVISAELKLLSNNK